ncbi:unnamed protein product [Timema podura]|uniref:Uncharacterized protein n=1 Tax=Timema podura TaxID=61482 RepID=A0ABN7NDY6_TIMPD|nr:unnamed protein product [Timema podura]
MVPHSIFVQMRDLLDELSKIKPSIPSDLGVVLDHLTRKEFLTNENPSILTLLAMIFSQLHRYIHLVEYSSHGELAKFEGPSSAHILFVDHSHHWATQNKRQANLSRFAADRNVEVHIVSWAVLTMSTLTLPPHKFGISSGEEERKIGIWFTCNFLQSHPSMRGECLDYLKRRTNDDEVEVVLMVIDGLHRAVCFDPTVFSDDTQPLNLIAELALHHEEFNVRQRAIKTLAHVHHKYKHEENIASSKKILVWIRNTILKHCISRPANRDRSVVDNMWTMYLVNPRLSPEKRMDTLLQIWVSLDEDAQAGYHKLASHHIE